jgi:hypothetical protein
MRRQSLASKYAAERGYAPPVGRWKRSVQGAIVFTVAACMIPAVAAAGTATIDTETISLGKSNGLEYRQATSMFVAQGVSRGAAAQCAGKQTTLGGGAAVLGATGHITDWAPFPGFRSRRSWMGTFTNGVSGNVRMRATAVCGRSGGREVRKKIVENAPADTEVVLRAHCPKDSRVSGGGVRFDDDESQSRASIPFDAGDKDSKPDDGWKAIAYPTTTADVGVVAICFRNLPLTYKTVTAGPFPGTTSYTMQPTCKEGHALTAGGGQVGGSSPGNVLTDLDPQDHFSDDDDVPDDYWNTGIIIEAGQTATGVGICKK